jgi:hypothetical protein
MNLRFPVVIATAAFAGLIGGLASRLLTLPNLSERYGPIRATRIELVDNSGRTIAFIGTDKQQDTALVFLDEKNRERAKFGVWQSSYTPKMVMTGGDGNERVVFHLSAVDDRPMILLRDHERTRVYLGFYQNDAPSPMEEDWGIRFYGPHLWEDSLAAVGMRRDWNDDKMQGFVFAKGKEGQKFFEPK